MCPTVSKTHQENLIRCIHENVVKALDLASVKFCNCERNLLFTIIKFSKQKKGTFQSHKTTKPMFH